MTTRKRVLFVVPAIGLALAASAPAVAQAPADRASAGRIDEVVVTARKREESLQDVPISVSALTLQQIERQGISNLADVARFTPALTWSEGQTPWDSKPAIRGQTSPRAASEPAVSIFVDGNLVPWRSGLNLNNIAIERIEVVKGPQSAMFGRGVLSGAVNYVTRRPGDEFGGWVEAGVGQRGRTEFSGWLDLPVNDELAFGVSGRWMDFSDGYYRNNLTGRDGIGAEKTRAGAVSMSYDPGGIFQAYARASHSTQEQGQPAYHTVPSNTQIGPLPNQIWFVGKLPTDANLIENNCDECAGIERDVTWVTANLDWNLDAGTISSLTGYNRTKGYFDQDVDHQGLSEVDLPVGFLQNNLRQVIDRDIKNLSQEVRFTSRQDNPVRWLAGLYYYEERMDEAGASITGTVLTPADVTLTPQSYDITAYAAFAAVEWDWTEQLTAGLELRRAREKADVDFIFGGAPRNLDDSWDAWLPRATLDFRLSDDVMFYLAAAKGTKPGGFNTALGAGAAQLPEDLLSFDEERAWSYELGMKSQWLDRSLTLNAAIYYIDWKAVQVNAQFVPPPPATGVTGYTANAGSADVAGGEFDLSWRPTDALELRLGYAYSPARIDAFVETRLAGAPVDLSGDRRLPYSSDHTGNLSVIYTQELAAGWSGFVQTDVQYRSTQYATIAELAETGARTAVDLRLGVIGEAWEATVFVNNLFNDDTALSVTPFVNAQTFARNFIVHVPPQRLWGLRLRYNF